MVSFIEAVRVHHYKLVKSPEIIRSNWKTFKVMTILSETFLNLGLGLPNPDVESK